MKSVLWSSCSRLSCSNQQTPSVVLCLTDSSLLAPAACPVSGVSPFAFTTLDAVLTKSWKDCATGCATVFRYLFSYDENLLTDPTTALTTAQVSGVFCKGCLTEWIKEEVGNEVYIRDNHNGTLTLVTQHGCEYTFSGMLT